ncbi:ABC transporter substrate-binding protein [Halomicrobium sp. HM KBTZ05]|uniref:ABC transporter substrate-binding protein n=1 Tax=Halomicrobium sp. HM KBTZ05 TaxID=3242663 RepID=UPI003558CE32
MSSGVQQSRGGTFELVHHYVGGDGEAALRAMMDGFADRHSSISVRETHYDNMRLQVKSRILGEDPPDVWTGWPGGEMAGYAEVDAVKDITDLWEASDMAANFRSVAADVAQVDGRYHAVPVTIHRANDMYLHTETVESIGFDPARASDPTELVEMLETIADDHDGPALLLPMADPFTVLQLWEITLLGLSDHATFEAMTTGNASRHRDVIVSALEHIQRFAALSSEDSLYDGMTDANEQFIDGAAPVYPQGDWAAGVFDETPDFEFQSEWDRVAFPGTENMFAVVMDSFIPSSESDSDALETFLEYVGSCDGQERFSRKKGSLPARKDASIDGFTDFGKSQHQQLDRSTEQPQTITHGLSMSSAQLVDLKAAIAGFIDEWDAQATADEMIGVFDR